MKAKKIRKIFNIVFNGMNNPIFNNSIAYFRHKNYVCEIAISEPINSCNTKWRVEDFCNKSPLLILEGLFMGDMNPGYYVTVLKRNDNGKFEKTELNRHLNNVKGELNTFINTVLQ